MEPATLPAAASCDSSSVTVESDEEQDLPVVVEDDDDDPPDIAELFAAAKAEFRELLREIPAIHRRSVMRQVYEQLITEEVEQW
jgi:DNA-directed RNA polymerase specialized sigma24 family protein